MNIIEILEKEQLRKDIPDFGPGDTVRVHEKITNVFLLTPPNKFDELFSVSICNWTEIDG